MFNKLKALFWILRIKESHPGFIEKIKLFFRANKMKEEWKPTYINSRDQLKEVEGKWIIQKINNLEKNIYLEKKLKDPSSLSPQLKYWTLSDFLRSAHYKLIDVSHESIKISTFQLMKYTVILVLALLILS